MVVRYLQLPSVPGILRGQWPGVLSRWHHAAFYQWLQWHTAQAGRLPGAQCPHLDWEWHRWAARVKEDPKQKQLVSLCQLDGLFPVRITFHLVAAGIAQQVWQQFGTGSKVPHGKPDQCYSAVAHRVWGSTVSRYHAFALTSFLARMQLMIHITDIRERSVAVLLCKIPHLPKQLRIRVEIADFHLQLLQLEMQCNVSPFNIKQWQNAQKTTTN